MADALGPLQQAHVEVRDAAGAHLSVVDQPGHLAPRVLDRRSDPIGPVELVQIDALDAEPPERRFDLLADRFRTQVALRLVERPRRIGNHAAFGEDVGPLATGDLAQRPSDHFLRVPEAVDRRRIDPVDAARDGVADRRDRIGVVLASPAVGPAPASDGPGAEADLRDSKTGSSQRTLQERFHRAFSFSYVLTMAEMSKSGVWASTAAKS